MWSIFSCNQTDADFFQAFKLLEAWKSDLFAIKEEEVKHYFAQKVVSYFDNMMIFHQKRGLHQNLMEALSLSEKEMANAAGVFKPIHAYWLQDDDKHLVITFGLEKKYYDSLQRHSFSLMAEDVSPMNGRHTQMKFQALQMLVFDIDLVNFSQSWINYTPSLEQRSEIQTRFILTHTHFKKNELSMVEKINFEKNLKTHPQYEELYQKVLRIMPKIETSLEQEWRTNIITAENLQAGNKKKTGLK
jgi:hypothetical protein